MSQTCSTDTAHRRYDENDKVLVEPLAPGTRILELESLRGLAAVLVVLFHFPKWNPILESGIINNGYLMVDFFFVLSGFVIFNAYAERITSFRDLTRFQFLRLGRLYPVHLVFLLLYLIVEMVKYFAAIQSPATDFHEVPFGKNNWVAFVQQLFLVQAIGLTGNHLTFNDSAWSISVEFYTYLVFGVILLLLKSIKTYVFFVLALLSLALLLTHAADGFTDLLRCFSGFFVGCLTAVSLKHCRVQIPSFVSVMILTLILIFLHLKTTKEFDVLMYLLTSALTASLVLSNSGLLKKLLNIKLFTWLGSISYSLYMAHGFALYLVAVGLRRILKRPEVQLQTGQWVASLTIFETLAVVLFVLAFVALASQLVYSLVEKPMRARSRKVTQFKPS